MNITQVSNDICTGCAACAQKCPHDAIKMTSDVNGFLHPVVDGCKCVNCGNCVAICPQQKVIQNDTTVTNVYACQALDKDILLEATAGGFFPVLSKYIILDGGVVFGAVYDDQMKVVHGEMTSVEKIKNMSGSKYVQSDISHILVSVKKALYDGKEVLFSGTPCQIDAVKAYCSDLDCSGLYTVDVVCYGVPSPKLFNDYINILEKKHNAKVCDFRFRDKHTNGWSHTTVIRFKDNNGNFKSVEEKNYANIPYYRMFARRDCFRTSCYHCRYNNLHRCSDFTTGNFWNINEITEIFDTKLGVSMVLVNSEKGQRLFEKTKKYFISEKRTMDEAIKANEALVKASSMPWQRNLIYKYYETHGFVKMEKHFYSSGIVCKVRLKLGCFKSHLTDLIQNAFNQQEKTQ